MLLNAAFIFICISQISVAAPKVLYFNRKKKKKKSSLDPFQQIFLVSLKPFGILSENWITEDLYSRENREKRENLLPRRFRLLEIQEYPSLNLVSCVLRVQTHAQVEGNRRIRVTSISFIHY